MKRSVEKLSHFQCKGCDKWWSIGDAPEDRKNWFCPWCGLGQVEEEGEQPQVDFVKGIKDALAEMDGLFKFLGEELAKANQKPKS